MIIHLLFKLQKEAEVVDLDMVPEDKEVLVEVVDMAQEREQQQARLKLKAEQMDMEIMVAVEHKIASMLPEEAVELVIMAKPEPLQIMETVVLVDYMLKMD